MTGRKILQYAIGPIGAGVLMLFTLPVLAWFYSTDDIGRLNIAQVLINLGILLFSVSMHEAYVREYHEVEDKGVLLRLALIPGMLLLAVAVIVVQALGIPLSSLLFEIDSDRLGILLMVAVVLSFLINILVHVLRMQERGLAFSFMQLTPRLVFLGLIALLYVAGGAHDFFDLLSAHTVSLAVTCVLAILLVRQDLWLALRHSGDRALMRRMLKFGLPLVVGGLSYWGLTALDRVFLKWFSNLTEVGIYAVAASLAASMSVISAIFSSIWHPIIYKWAKAGADLVKVQRVMDCMTLGVALVWSLFGIFAPLVTFFLPQAYEQVPFLVVACVAMPLFYVLSETTVVGIGISRKSYFAMLASLSALCVNVMLNYLLIPAYGAKGAALACLLSFFIFFVARTEFSAFAWQAFARRRIYLVALAYLGISGAILSLGLSPWIGTPLWLLGALWAGLLFRDRVWEILQYAQQALAARRMPRQAEPDGLD